MASPSLIEGGLQRWAHPRVLVLSSPDVERLLRKNHLTFPQLLRPLGESLDGVGVPAASFRSAQGKGYSLKNFGVKFVAPLELDALATPSAAMTAADGTTTPAADAADAAAVASAELYLDSVLRAAEPPQDRYNDGIQEAGDVPSFLRRNPEPTPWFTRYRGEFHEVLRYNEAELLDQPLALLVAVSTGDSNPLNLVEALRAPKNLPQAFQRGLYDSTANMLRCIVVLHDQAALAAQYPGEDEAHVRERAANTFRLLKKQFGAEVIRMVEVNSLASGGQTPNNRQKDLWAGEVARAAWMQQRLGMGTQQSQQQQLQPAAAAAAAASAASSVSPDAGALVAASSPSTPSSPFPSLALPSGEVRGQYLSTSDLSGLSAFIADFVLKSLLPHLERKLALLADRVAEKRKGFKNSFKALFGKTRDANKKNPWIPRMGTYEWGSIESQARQLADLAFVVQDYDLAASSYRLAAADYKADLSNYRQEHGLHKDSSPIPRIDPSHPRFDLERERHRKYFEAMTRHSAGAHEMLALSMALGEYSAPISRSTILELSQSIEMAVRDYQGVGDLRRATRAAWFYADVMRWVGGATRVPEGAAMMLRASEQRSVRAALCMEQAAYLYLHVIPLPLVRKYSFALYRAGVLFHECGSSPSSVGGGGGARAHSVRAFSSATSMYAHRAWFDILDRLNQHLGREHAALQRWGQSVGHYVELIGKSQSVAGVKPRQNQEKQKQFLSEFVEIVNRWRAAVPSSGQLLPSSGGKSPNAGLVPGLKLPTVQDESIVVRTNDPFTVPLANTTLAWKRALRVNPLMSLTDKELANKDLFAPSWENYRESERGCVVGESIQVSFECSNPLLIPLQCAHLRLKCKWKSANGDEEEESSEGVDAATLSAGQAAPPSARFSYTTLSLSLGPLASARVTLVVTPLRQGVLHVEGLLWDVMGVLQGFHPFALPMRQVTFPVVGGRRRKPELQVDPSLVVPVMGVMPLLQVEVRAAVHSTAVAQGSQQHEGFPRHLVQSEVVERELKLRNAGKVALHQVCVRTSHPGFIALAPPAHPSSTSSSSSSSAACYTHTWNEGFISLPLVLAPGEEATLALYVRGTIEGPHQVGFLIKYEPLHPQQQPPQQNGGAPSPSPSPSPPVASAAAAPSSSGSTTAGTMGPSLKYRLAYLSFPLLVTPLFSAKALTRPSFASLATTVLAVELGDRQQLVPGLANTIEYAAAATVGPSGGPVRNLEVQVTQMDVFSQMWAIAPLEAPSSSQGAGEEGEVEDASARTGLHSPRPLHSSISSPAVSSLMKQPPRHILPAHPAAASTAVSTPGAHAPLVPLPPAFVLRPYENLVMFARVSNLPGGVGANGQQQHADKAHPHPAHPLHASQSANSLQHAMAPPKPHHSRVMLSSASAAATPDAAAPLAVTGWDTSSPAIAHLLHMEKALLIEEEKQILIVNPAAQLADVGAPNRIDLVLGWVSADGTRRGVHHSPGLACMKPAPSACSLKVLLEYPRAVGHDFLRQGWLDSVAVRVRIRNILEEAPVTFAFETLPPEEEFDAGKRSFRQVLSPALRARYTWQGSTKCRVSELPAGQQCEIQLYACFTAAGVYNLNRFRFTVEVPGRKPRVFFFPLQHLIHVAQQQQSDAQQQQQQQQADASNANGDNAATAAAADAAAAAAAASSSDSAASSVTMLDLPGGSGLHEAVLEAVEEVEQDEQEQEQEQDGAAVEEEGTADATDAEAEAAAAAAAAEETDGDGVAEAGQQQAADDLGQVPEEDEEEAARQQQQDPDESVGLA